jgi:hypothetical protein
MSRTASKIASRIRASRERREFQYALRGASSSSMRQELLAAATRANADS